MDITYNDSKLVSTEKEYDSENELKVEDMKQGDRIVVKIGNTVVEVMKAYSNSNENTQLALVEYYKYSQKKPWRFSISNAENNQVVDSSAYEKADKE